MGDSLSRPPPSVYLLSTYLLIYKALTWTMERKSLTEAQEIAIILHPDANASFLHPWAACMMRAMARLALSSEADVQ